MQRVRMSSHHLDRFSEPDSCFEPLISGLPDDIALNCLLRLPVEFHSTGRTVCRRWCSLFGNKTRFFTKRKEMGFKDPWLFVFCFDKCNGKAQWHVLDLVHYSWHTIPAMPCMENDQKVSAHGFRCVSVPGERSLLVFGGVGAEVDCPLNLGMRFDVDSDRWIVLKKMITPRMFFAGGVIGGRVYVAGGNGNDRFELDSGEVMDPKEGVWRPIASMGASMACYDAAVVDGKLFVTEGWSWPFYFVPRGQVYDPKTDKWECMATGLREGWTGSSVVMFGRLFVVSEHERTRLKVYDSGNDTWETVNGAPLPEQICKPFVVNGCDDRIYVTGRNLYVAVGFIHRLNGNSTDGKLDFVVRWQVVEGPHDCSDLTPSSVQILSA
ncbi:putative kelch-type beta propeller, F-box-like domain superfamily [Helianthus annuus]|uniref:Kelch-type beta propeller, F-box-like domain superfamily n=1 Tax=Helianthus annuus TaxID=4232 RepID=A0A251S245_HELAN|nr:F-box/kelch-repeat protein At1g30090 [Helianthus annuus]KAF5761762.1 putative kelch-type beta propeller, F-box-like domain superfamily [Helianthus annuus]KAJ0461928.1 putative kelch-type beta propeller, F-box-like domain superfamily [Helianthus annuus]KAJ0646201.1 putative kelch-type beta propeller, F-box-like domain superfamily [Helianthus annuus]